MTERQREILLAVVKEYIKNASPVGSKLLAQMYDFNISPATFRSEFAELERMGYLWQPYTSAGRVPTDKGYRFFVNYVLQKRLHEREKIKNAFLELARLKKRQDQLFAELTRVMSEFSRNVVLSGPIDSRMLFKAGINEILTQPEFSEESIRREFGSLMDSFEDKIKYILGELQDDNVLVLIGKESPFLKLKDFSLIVTKCNISGSDGLVAILGPKRMDYAKNINLINSLKRLL